MSKFSEKKFSDSKRKNIISEAKKHIGNFRSIWSKNISRSSEMTRFLNGEMWLEEEISAYNSSNRAILTFNKLRPYLRQIAGEDADFSADIKIRNVVDPESEDNQQIVQTSEKNKDILTGLVRNIAYNSKTKHIYANGYIQCLEGGYSSWRVVVVEDKQGLLSLRVRSIDNPLQCYWDLNARSSTKTDGDFAGLISYMSKDAFKREYPNIQYPDSFSSPDDYKVNWGDEDRIAIGEEYRRESYKQKIYTLPDSTEVTDEDLKELEPDNIEYIKSNAISTRIEKKSRIIHYKFTDNELLEWSETPFSDIPLIFVPGYSRIIDGLQQLYPFAQDAKDSQRLVNFLGSEMVQWLKLTKKTKFIGPGGIIDDYIDDWKNPDSPSIYLAYNADRYPGAKPEPLPPIPMPQDLVEQYSRAEMDIQKALGRYEANIGAQSNDTSGISIFNRAVQGNSSLAEYRRGRNEAIEETGRIILNAIPKVYDTQRTVTITNKNGEDSEQPINSPTLDLQSGQYTKQNSFLQNTYTIEVDIGDSFPMQRAATAEMAKNLATADPQGRAYSLVADIIAENIDVDGAQKIASRLRTLVPPNIIAQETGQQPPADPTAMMQQQAAQLEMQAQQLKMQIEQQKSMDDHMRAMNDRIKAMADMLTAQTNQFKVLSGQKLDQQRVNAEMARTESDLLQAESQEAREHVKLHMDIENNKIKNDNPLNSGKKYNFMSGSLE